jgi:Flp pilus assembly protein TadG
MTVAPRRLCGEEGQVTAFVVVFTVALVFVAGLVIDGGGLLTTKRQAINTAEQAARAGAQGLAIDELRATGDVRLDPQRATDAAEEYLAATGHTGTATVTDDRVTVTVAIRWRPLILGIGGMRTVTVSGQAAARNVRGVAEADP